MKALYPGTFDPITNGHLDIIWRGVMMFDEVIVAVSSHGRKTSLFSIEKRCKLIREATKDMPTVKVIEFNNLSVDCAEKNGAGALIRGLRMTSDFEYEFTMAKFMAEQNQAIQPVYLMAAAHLTHISSTSVKEITKLNGDISKYVPKHVEEALKNALPTIRN